jgi:hypothetical protein
MKPWKPFRKESFLTNPEKYLGENGAQVNKNLQTALNGLLSKRSVQRVNRALKAAASFYEGNCRDDGSPYFRHNVVVTAAYASVLKDFFSELNDRMVADACVACTNHDSIEDYHLGYCKYRMRFGRRAAKIASLVTTPNILPECINEEFRQNVITDNGLISSGLELKGNGKNEYRDFFVPGVNINSLPIILPHQVPLHRWKRSRGIDETTLHLYLNEEAFREFKLSFYKQFIETIIRNVAPGVHRELSGMETTVLLLKAVDMSHNLLHTNPHQLRKYSENYLNLLGELEKSGRFGDLKAEDIGLHLLSKVCSASAGDDVSRVIMDNVKETARTKRPPSGSYPHHSPLKRR